MKIERGVMGRGAILALVLGLSQPGCYRHVPVGAVEVNEAGTAVAGTPTSSSIVWPNGRICTLGAGGMPPARWKPGPPDPTLSAAHAPSGGFVDAFLFRLCEARANGDISQEQYHALVERFLSALQRRDEKLPGVPARRAQPWSRPQRDPRLWHGEDAAGLSGPVHDPLTPAPGPTQPGFPPPAEAPPPAQAPVAPPAPPNTPSSGSMPDTRR